MSWNTPPSAAFLGLLPCAAVAAVAWPLGRAFPVAGGAVIALVAGILLSPLLGLRLVAKSPLAVGIKAVPKKLLQVAVVLLGFEMDLRALARIGGESAFVMAFTLSAAFLCAIAASKALQVTGRVPILIGVGTAICGGSAIAAVAPAIGADDDEIARSVSTIFLFNVIAALTFPWLGRMLGLSDRGFGMWAGTAINDTSSVVAAGSAWAEYAGNDVALRYATAVKLTRTLAIVPVTFVLSLHAARRRGALGRGNFRLASAFPWFVLGFLAASAARTFLPFPGDVFRALGVAGKVGITAAMAGIGLNTNFRRLLSNGKGPILLGLACWAAVALTSLAVQAATGML